MEITEGALVKVCTTVMPHLDERQRRILAGALAWAAGRGGIAAVAAATGMSRSTLQGAVSQVDAGIEPSTRVRRPGGGRPRLVDPGALLGMLVPVPERGGARFVAEGPGSPVLCGRMWQRGFL